MDFGLMPTYLAYRAVAMQRRAIGEYTRHVSRQRLGKHVPVARQQILNNATVGLRQRKWVFPCGSCQDVICKG
jgi:hypothetical protein